MPGGPCVVYGTSHSAERAFPPWRTCGGAWIAALRADPNFPGPVINRSGWGRDSRWGVAQFGPRVLALRPAAVLIEFALNDAEARRRISVGESVDNLRILLDALSAAFPEARPVVMTTNPAMGKYAARRPRLPDYQAAWRAVAHERRCALADLEPVWERLHREDPARFERGLPDGLHPAPEAAGWIVPGVRAALGVS